MRKHFPLYLVLPVLFACNNQPKQQKKDDDTKNDTVQRAHVIHDKVLTMDTHVDFDPKNFTDSINYTQDLNTQVNLPKIESGGLDLIWFSVYTGQGSLDQEGYDKAYKNAIDKFNAVHWFTEEFAPDKMGLALTSEEARKIAAEGKKVAMLGVENAYPIGTDISRVKEFWERGARYMSLAHNGHSQLSDSNTGEADSTWLHNGLSDLGKQVVAEMNKYGIMIDISHPSKKAMRDMLDITTAPIIASHSGARALCDHSRNLDDEQLEWIKENGGVVQTVAFAGYVNLEKSKKMRDAINKAYDEGAKANGFEILRGAKLRALSEADRADYDAKYEALKVELKPTIDSLYTNGDPVTVADFVDHIDYMVNKIGIDHVGISSDFDGGGGIYGWNDASETFNVTLELVKRGYTEEQIAKLWGGNLFRVLDEVQAAATYNKE
ncbi:dipeptidase [Sinomicrobium sp.]